MGFVIVPLSQEKDVAGIPTNVLQEAVKISAAAKVPRTTGNAV